MKMMSPVCDEKEWTTYVGVVMKSEIRGVELVGRMVFQNNVGDKSSWSPTLPEAVDEQHVECGIVLTQLLQETQANTDVEETPLVASNETLLNIEPKCQSVAVGDAGVAVGLISGVNSQPVATGFALDVDPSFPELEFMLKYEATSGDEHVEHSVDDRPVPELNKRGKALLQRALVEHAPEMLDCQDLSQAHRAVADGLWFDDSIPLINDDNVIIRKGCYI
jgi:hypothetical protein